MAWTNISDLNGWNNEAANFPQLLQGKTLNIKLMKGLRVTSFILMTLGILLYVVGILFKIQHWPDMFKTKISGPTFLLIGVTLFIISVFTAQKNKK